MKRSVAGLAVMASLLPLLSVSPSSAGSETTPVRKDVVIWTGGMTPLGFDEVLVVSAALKPSFVQVPKACESNHIPVQVQIVHAETGVVVQAERAVLGGNSRLFESSYRLTVDRDFDERHDRVLFHPGAVVPSGAQKCISVTVDVLAPSTDTGLLNTKFQSVATEVQNAAPGAAVDPVTAALIAGFGVLAGFHRRRKQRRS